MIKMRMKSLLFIGSLCYSNENLIRTLLNKKVGCLQINNLNGLNISTENHSKSYIRRSGCILLGGTGTRT